MKLTSDFIVHTTDDLKAVASILCDGFKVSYCREQFTLSDNDYYIGVPVVSFSDIPIEQLLSQRTKYGKYSIELSKKWAIKMGLNPVIYLSNDSYPCKLIEPFLIDVEKDGSIGNINVQYKMVNGSEEEGIDIIDLNSEERQIRINGLVGILSFAKNRVVRVDNQPFS